MADTRTRIEKLRAMAEQTESPQEAEIAKRILEEMGEQEKVWGTSATPEEIFRAFSSSGSIGQDAINVFAAAFGFRVDFNASERPIEARWSGDLRSQDAPIAEMVEVFRKKRQALAWEREQIRIAKRILEGD